MTDKEILEKAISQAIDGGWKMLWIGNYIGIGVDAITGEIVARIQYKDITPFTVSLLGIIFNHDFAKALWGDKRILKEVITEEGTRRTWYSQEKDWKEHLQQMVIAEDPIKYLGDNI